MRILELDGRLTFQKGSKTISVLASREDGIKVFFPSLGSLVEQRRLKVLRLPRFAAATELPPGTIYLWGRPLAEVRLNQGKVAVRPTLLRFLTTPRIVP
ncbi:MAG: hypothetical protein ACFCU4_00165 [Puniceicoccaceae bacterium]